MEATFEGGQDPEVAVAPYMDGMKKSDNNNNNKLQEYIFYIIYDM